MHLSCHIVAQLLDQHQPFLIYSPIICFYIYHIFNLHWYLLCIVFLIFLLAWKLWIQTVVFIPRAFSKLYCSSSSRGGLSMFFVSLNTSSFSNLVSSRSLRRSFVFFCWWKFTQHLRFTSSLNGFQFFLESIFFSYFSTNLFINLNTETHKFYLQYRIKPSNWRILHRNTGGYPQKFYAPQFIT